MQGKCHLEKCGPPDASGRAREGEGAGLQAVSSKSFLTSIFILDTLILSSHKGGHLGGDIVSVPHQKAGSLGAGLTEPLDVNAWSYYDIDIGVTSSGLCHLWIR